MIPEYITQEFLDSQKDTLLMYKGGGYSGCIWEWNFCWFDEDGEMIDIYSSGYDGCKTKEDILKKFDEYTHEHFIPKADLQKEFAEEYQEELVLKINTWLIDHNYIDWDYLTQVCECCGQVIILEDLYHSGYKGNGGIGTIQTGLICGECQRLGEELIQLFDEDNKLIHEMTMKDIYYDKWLNETFREELEHILTEIRGVWEPEKPEGQAELDLGLPNRTNYYKEPMVHREIRNVDFEWNGEKVATMGYWEY